MRVLTYFSLFSSIVFSATRPIYWKYYSGGPFCTPFLQGPIFDPPKKQKKGKLTDFRRKNDENFGFCLFYLGHFSTKERNICLFVFVLSNFVCFNPRGKRNSGTLGQILPFLRPNSFFSIVSDSEKHFDKNLTHLWELISEL